MARKVSGITHILDTSAILAHYWDEQGAGRMDELFGSSEVRLGISAVTVAELRNLLAQEAPIEGHHASIVSMYVDDLTTCIPVDRMVAELAWQLRQAGPHRLPLVDAIIAATARARGAILVHKDSHLARIPTAFVEQLVLS